MTDLSRAIAIVSQHGRGNDTQLAHISPREAAILRLLGGSGAINPATGLTEFDDSGLTESYFSGSTPSVDYNLNVDQPASTGLTTGYFSGQQAQPDYNLNVDASSGSGTPSFSAAAPAATTTPNNFSLTDALSGGGGAAFPGATPSFGGGGRSTAPIGDQVAAATNVSAPTESGGGVVDQATDWLKKNRDLVGLAGTLGLGAYNQLRAGRQADAAQNRIKELAAPYKTQSEQYLNAAATGNLLPAQQQALQAMRAQAAQELTQSGQSSGVAAQQMEANVQRQAELFRQNLMQTGLQLAGISDQLTLDAINAGYQADQQAQQAANGFYLSVFKAIGTAGK